MDEVIAASPLYDKSTEFARIAARTDSLRSWALDYASRSFQITRDEREDAESKANAYLGSARAIFPASGSEATAYFEEAVRVASKVGDENLDRWRAMLDLADRANIARSPNPEAAYKLARCAEVTYAYVARDKHFDWESAVEAIGGLCPCSSLAILSRWRDRGFGRFRRLLPAAIKFLLESGSLDPRDALPLVGFRASWDEVHLLRATLNVSLSKGDKEAAAEFLIRYMALSGRNARAWKSLKEVLDLHGLVLSGLDELGSSDKKAEGPDGSGEAHEYGFRPVDYRDGSDWGPVFDGIDLATANGVAEAYRRFKTFDPPRHHEGFFKTACARVAVGDEAKFVDAVADVPELNLYHFDRFLEEFPREWRNRLAIKTALASGVKRICKRYCMEIAKGGYYEPLSLRKACDVSGLAEREIIDVTLSALGESAETFGARRLFTLISLLATKLSQSEALDALSCGFDLFESVTEANDGDGPWSAALAPPGEIEAAVAGYIWASLASPKGSLRWEAAHVVRGLCMLRRESVIKRIVELAVASKGESFADARLHFYDMHGRQWLQIGLARAAKETPESLLPHAVFLVELALSSEHVLIRGSAAGAALALIEGGQYGCQDRELRERLLAVNVSPLEVIESPRYKRFSSGEQGKVGPHEEAPLHLGLDFPRYWLAPLGEHFAKTEREMQLAVSDVITKEWRISSEAGWIPDERVRRKIFSDGETWESHGSYPSTHDLSFYLSYHATMIIAGRLLLSVSSHRDPEYVEDDFAQWLARHELTRPDGNWLADRRDPSPRERPKWNKQEQADLWRWSLRRDDFEPLLILLGGRLNLWGRWTVVDDSREESIAIKSAPVSPAYSTALLRALQCSGAYDYNIPAIDDDEINHGNFHLKAWINNSQRSARLDEQDPWAGDIVYPPLVPGDPVSELMGLHSDPEQRQWRMRLGERDEIVLWCQIWGQRRERDDDEEPESGRRLQGSFAFVLEFLRRAGMDLIITVEVARRLRHSRYYRGSSDEFEYVLPSARVFLAKSDGTICTV